MSDFERNKCFQVLKNTYLQNYLVNLNNKLCI